MKTKFIHKSLLKNVSLWVRIAIFALVAADIIMNIIYHNPSFAESVGVTPDLEGEISSIFANTMPILVGILATIVIIIAGIVYAFDLGGGKQSGVAKEMIMAAISGVILFILARWLLGEISGLFLGVNPTSNTTNFNGFGGGSYSNVTDGLDGGGASGGW